MLPNFCPVPKGLCKASEIKVLYKITLQLNVYNITIHKEKFKDIGIATVQPHLGYFQHIITWNEVGWVVILALAAENVVCAYFPKMEIVHVRYKMTYDSSTFFRFCQNSKQ
jgi:hypothetical protein